MNKFFVFVSLSMAIVLASGQIQLQSSVCECSHNINGKCAYTFLMPETPQLSTNCKTQDDYDPNCSNFLVSSLPDSKISSSSVWGPDARNIAAHHHSRSKLSMIADGRVNGGWSAATNTDRQWLQYDLGSVRKITGVVTKGRNGVSQFVTQYRVLYTNDTFFWQYILDANGKPKLFFGNVDTDSAQVNFLHPPISARYVRINPTKWVSHVSMRAELLGC